MTHRREEVETQTATIDIVVELLANHRHVRRFIHVIATTAELVDVVILCRKARVRRCLVVGSKTNGLRFQLCHIREAIVVAIVTITILNLTEDIDTHLIIVRNEGSTERRIEIGGAILHDICRMTKRKRITQRLFCDNVYHTSNSARSEECRTSTTYNLHTLDHRHRHKVETIDARQRREYGAAVEQYLRILTLKAIDT